MTVAAAITVNQILNRVAVEVGLASETDPYGSTSQHFVQMKQLLQSAGEELCLAHPWEFLNTDWDFTVDSTTQTEIDLPADFQSLVNGTGWNVTEESRLIGPVSPQQWDSVTNANSDNMIRDVFRIKGGKMNFYPELPLSTEISFEYQSRYFVQDATSGEAKANFTTGADIILFDRSLMIKYLKLMWFEAKGFDTTAAQNSFNQTFSMLVGKDKGAGIINVGRGGRLFRYLSVMNVLGVIGGTLDGESVTLGGEDAIFGGGEVIW